MFSLEDSGSGVKSLSEAPGQDRPLHMHLGDPWAGGAPTLLMGGHLERPQGSTEPTLDFKRQGLPHQPGSRDDPGPRALTATSKEA